MSERCSTEDGMVCFDRENLGCQTFEGPAIQGSRRTEKVPGTLASLGSDLGVSEGEKVKRKVLSPLRWSTRSDMATMCLRHCW